MVAAVTSGWTDYGVPTPIQPQVPKPRQSASAPSRLIDFQKICAIFLRVAIAMIVQKTSKQMDPFISSRIGILGAILLPQGKVCLILTLARSLHQATLLHKFLHESVNFMIEFRRLLYGICAGGPPLDFSVNKVKMVLARLACRLDEFFLDIGIRFRFGSSGIRLGHGRPRHCDRLSSA